MNDSTLTAATAIFSVPYKQMYADAMDEVGLNGKNTTQYHLFILRSHDIWNELINPKVFSLQQCLQKQYQMFVFISAPANLTVFNTSYSTVVAPVAKILMAGYTLLAAVLLMNLLIARFR